MLFRRRSFLSWGDGGGVGCCNLDLRGSDEIGGGVTGVGDGCGCGGGDCGQFSRGPVSGHCASGRVGCGVVGRWGGGAVLGPVLDPDPVLAQSSGSGYRYRMFVEVP